MKILAIFERNLANIPESTLVHDLALENLLRSEDDLDSAIANPEELMNLFDRKETHIIDRRPYSIICSSLDWENPGQGSLGFDQFTAAKYGQFTAMKDDVICLLKGKMKNCSVVVQFYGIRPQDSDAINIINLYKKMREPPQHNGLTEDGWFEAMDQLKGKFALVVSDSLKGTFFATSVVEEDYDNAPYTIFWGTDKIGNVVLTDQSNIAWRGCGRCFTTLPRGCFIMSGKGVRCLEGRENKIELLHKRNSLSNECGIYFPVDAWGKPFSVRKR